ncbi:MAG: glycosyltransferase [Planctomycetes bacterium]|jgi:glycosyltransferase involved in cell wall biosynthesis|nr:glycosyltransferase [Planctomycetota bacterium]
MAGGRGAVPWIVQDGVLAGPGASQTLPYLLALARGGRRVHLLSVEKERFLFDPRRAESARAELRAAGVGWTALPFGHGPAATRTAAQLLRLLASARGLIRRERIALVHARSCLPALVAAASGVPFVFDMRGFWAREKVDGGLWPEGSVAHRTFERVERALLRRAAGIVVLAEAARPLLPPLSVPVRVIPTAVDLDRFRPDLPPPPGYEWLRGRTVLAAAGALSNWYLREELLDFLTVAIAADPSTHALFLSEDGAGRAARDLAARGVDPARITALGVPPAEVPRWFANCAAGLLFVRAAPSKKGSAPTKLGEFLACGVPVVATSGVGDTEALLSGTRTGILLSSVDPAGYHRALAELAALRREGPELVRRCRGVAGERLSLGAAVRSLEELYDEVLAAAGR